MLVPAPRDSTRSGFLTRRWQRTDEDNIRWLGEVLSARGWPGRTLAAEDGATAVWLPAQYPDREPVRQRAFLDALGGTAGRGEVSPAHLACLEDRVAGQPALFLMRSWRR